MKLGFTGTRVGMSSAQLHTFHSKLLWYGAELEEFHHGCCVGADTQANYEISALRIPTVFHPPTNTDKMSDLRDFPGTWRKPAPYLVRNRAIVDETDVLIATPKGMREERRSGTWATVRYARSQGKTVWVIWRNGKIERG